MPNKDALINKENMHKLYLKNKDKVKQATTEWRAKNRDRHLSNARAARKRTRQTLKGKIANWRHSARRRGLDFNITLQDLEAIPLICHYTGEPLTLIQNHPNSISLDRLDSSKGYTPDNITFCCVVVNLMKLDLTIDEFKHWCGKVANHN